MFRYVVRNPISANLRHLIFKIFEGAGDKNFGTHFKMRYSSHQCRGELNFQGIRWLLITSGDKLTFYDFFAISNIYQSSSITLHLSSLLFYLCSSVFYLCSLVFYLCSLVFHLCSTCVHLCSTCGDLCSLVFTCVHLCSTCVPLVFTCVHLCSFVFICVHLCSFVFICVLHESWIMDYSRE